MCGLAGIVAARGIESTDALEAMRDALTHRGPDDCGLWLNEDRTVGLASRRLAILDLSPSGHQPMVDEEAGLALAFNGEIYNFIELRAELEQRGHRFRSSSDTEVLLAAYREWGRGCLAHLNGMFAFALWDSGRGELFAARDRFGEKPFYYCASADGWLFASEIKGLLAHPTAPRQPHLPAIVRFLKTAQVPDGTDETFFAGIRQLPAAHALVLRPGGQPQIERYWDLDPNQAARFAEEHDFVEGYRELLLDSVRCRLRSDVPVGSSLSGGLDSSSVVGLIALLAGDSAPARQVTFSARYEDARADEGAYIAAVVRRAELEAHEVWPSAETLLADMDRWVWHQEEPCPHTSQYAQWKVMELARQNGVTVLLDGQGADEYLAGYQVPAYGYRYAGLLREGNLTQLVQELSDYRRQQGRLSPALASLGAALLPPGLRAGLRARYHHADDLVATDFHHDLRAEAPPPVSPRFPTPLKQELYRQLTRTSLPSLLRYGDRNSMAFSVEARLPFLDHRLVEFAFGAPDYLLVRQGLTKVLLREAMRPVLPPEVYTRVSKLGFPTPEQLWLRGPLRGWLRGILDKAGGRPFVNRVGVEREWRRFLTGGESANLWRVAHTELWWQRFFG